MSGWLAVAAVAVVALGGLAGAAGCGKVTPDAVGGSGGSGGAGPSDAASDAPSDAPLTVAGACNRQAQAICDALGDCAQPWVQFLYGDKATCVARTLRACTDEQVAPGISRTAADIVTCADAVAQASCADLLASRLPAACAVKPGTLMNGLACGSDWQCQSTYCLKRNSDCGTCGPRAAASGDCLADDGCLDGLKCAASKCAVPGDLGASCKDPEQPCRSDLYCPATGKCAAKLGTGGVCTDAIFTACDIAHGYVCNLITCNQVTVAKGGESCGGGSRSVCMGLNPCLGEMTNVPGTCANPAGDGEACGPGAQERKCLPPAICTNGVCRLPSAPSCR